uniref:hypothetical protein n=1 Tax=Enterobacter asburiae TaxID=61645 RepID=UPI001595899A|nr:hypothetical protein [Enterobacter asburiae]
MLETNLVAIPPKPIAPRIPAIICKGERDARKCAPVVFAAVAICAISSVSRTAREPESNIGACSAGTES